MAAEVAGRRRHLAGWAVRGGALPCWCGGAAKSLRILICSLQTNNSELPMRRFVPCRAAICNGFGLCQSQPLWSASAKLR